MFSSQGTSTNTSSGVSVRQTIGQQSAIGNYRNSYLIVGQGFLQSNKMKILIIESIWVKPHLETAGEIALDLKKKRQNNWKSLKNKIIKKRKINEI